MRLPLSALIGLFFTGLFLFTAIFAQWIAPYPIDAAVGGVWEAPSAQFWLGTDTIGRDILSRLIYGGQVTIFVALASSVLAFSLGSFLGFLAAVRGGLVIPALVGVTPTVAFVTLPMAVGVATALEFSLTTNPNHDFVLLWFRDVSGALMDELVSKHPDRFVAQRVPMRSSILCQECTGQ